jgi:hypothetical protein
MEKAAYSAQQAAVRVERLAGPRRDVPIEQREATLDRSFERRAQAAAQL